MRAKLLAAIVFIAACTPPAVAASPSVAPSFDASSAPTPSPTPSAAGFADAPPGADWPAVVVYTVTNDGVAHEVSRAGTTDVGRVCEGPGALGMLARADGAAFLVRCIGSSTDEDALAILDVASGRVTHLGAHPMSSFSLAWSPDGRSVAFFKLGDCTVPAPVCQNRAVIDVLSTGAARETAPRAYAMGGPRERAN